MKERRAQAVCLRQGVSVMRRGFGKLHYADRVKELCVGESAEQDVNFEFDEAEDEVEEEDEAEGSLQQSGLAQLQTLAVEEVNEDWIQYRESLAAMQVCINRSIFFESFVLV